MRVIYNGIDLQCLETLDYSMEGVLDPTGTDYLYTRHTLAVRGVINGYAEVFAVSDLGFRNGPPIAYRMSMGAGAGMGVGGPVPGTTPPGTDQSATAPAVPAGAPNSRQGIEDPQPPIPFGNVNTLGGTQVTPAIAAGVTNTLFRVDSIPISPTETLRSIRHRLTTPRGRLYIFSGGWDGNPPAPVILQSPLDGMRCDSRNGPFPKILSISQVFGDANTFLVDFAVETYVNEAKENGVTNPGVLLSNRFKQIQDTDKDSYTTISTLGTAIFRTDLLYNLPTTPDSLRPLLFIPIPPEFVRENIQVEGLADVTGVNYQYSDRQMKVNFHAAPFVHAASISAIHRQAVVNSADVLDGALSVYERVMGVRANKHIADSANPKERAAKSMLPTPNHPFVLPPSAPPAAAP